MNGGQDVKDTEMEKAVLRFKDGRLLKGYLAKFSPRLAKVVLKEEGNSETHTVKMADLKAVFFVRSFEGDRSYKEKKTYGATKPRGNRLFIKFSDGESLVGFLKGTVPWDKGFFLSKPDRTVKGFYVLPVDADANNLKVFVVSSAVTDVTVVP
jgi:hypothetical protein